MIMQAAREMAHVLFILLVHLKKVRHTLGQFLHRTIEDYNLETRAIAGGTIKMARWPHFWHL